MKNSAWVLARHFVIIFLILIAFVYISYGQTLENYKLPNDYRGIIHLHSELSHDSAGTFADIVEAAKNNEIDFVVMTDHWSPGLYEKSRRGFVGNILFIAGTEISKNDGITLIAFPLPKDFVPENGWRKNIASLRKKGSLVLASHIEFSETAQLTGFDGIEITNLHAILIDRSYFGFMWVWFNALWPPNWNLGYLFNDIKNLPRWHYLNQGGPLPAFGGNDMHNNYRLFWKIGPKLGSYNNTFKLITTHIWASEPSEQFVKEAIKNGQSYFAFEVFGNTKGFRFYATDGIEVFLPGKRICTEKITFTIQAPPHENPSKTKIKILRDGKLVKEGSGILLNLEATKPGSYYTEIWKDDKPWIFSNPIKIK